MNLKLLIVIISFNLLFISISVSQVRVLTLQECISNAIENDENIIKTRYSIESQTSIIRTKYGALIPSLSVNGGWNRTNQILNTVQTVNGFPVSLNTNETESNLSLSLRSDVTLFNGFSNYVEIDVARMNRRNYQLQEERIKNELAIRVINNYVTVLKNQQIVAINEARLQDARDQLEKIRMFVEVGKRTVSDIYKQDVQVAQYELAVEQSKNNVQKSIADLVEASGLPQDREYTVRADDVNIDLSFNSMNAFVQSNNNVNLLVNRAYQNRYEVKQILQTIDINEANLEIQSNHLVFPTVSAFSNYNVSGNKFGNMFDARIFTVGLNLSYPIFQGFQLSNLRQQAELSVLSSEQDLQNTKAKIELDIKKAVLDLRSLIKQIEISERTLRAAEQDKTLAEVSYQAGLATLLDVQTATIQYNNALIERSNLNYNFILAQKQLEFYQGLLKY